MSKLVKIKTLKTVMKVISGIRIVGNSTEINIGGIDNPIIKEPLEGYPYIPGSSLKGVMRSLAEKSKGLDSLCDCDNCKICTLFGSAKADSKSLRRLIVRDSYLTENSKKILDKFLPYGAEIKKENTINRTTGKATPRTLDRIPKGVSFNIYFTIKLYENDKEEDYISFLKSLLKMIEFSGIGGSISRGYGQVSFSELKIEDTYDIEEELNKYLNNN
ncbi:type III-A CRISPR-associated RAMP protein Csm3 [Crassaminicella thermophila]|uniref:CRISPR system Cms endoribonuclease Csm3 n=1 Tax=Crassaminicella thermophila TaxID=2599308 RepID=A0A5C0SAF5_CRATE|nr:type III-A CRISPR-associated RAMP protein Csm3 [Crassaminicella thermophila]QEK11535.1 type III-A CRISPR-associated RAMP protein Csm3 [Crassaminicella thermophila]